MSVTIFNHGGSGAPGLRVIAVSGAAALPASAAEGMLAVTGSTITEVYAQRTRPASAAEGAAWIVTGTSAEITVNLALRGSLCVYPLRALRYADGAWAAAELWARIGGSWQSGRYTLYDYGALGCGVYSESESAGTVEAEADSLHITLTGNTGANQALAVFSGVNLTDRTELHVRGDVITNRYTVYVADAVSPYGTLLAQVVTTDGETVVDVSQIMGAHIVLIGQGAGQVMEARIYEVYLL